MIEKKYYIQEWNIKLNIMDKNQIKWYAPNE